VKNPFDPTPTEMVWRMEGDRFVVGTEMPIDPDHMERVAGTHILDEGQWRLRRYIGMKLPTDPNKAETWVRLNQLEDRTD
jgi:hypothetical protein